VRATHTVNQLLALARAEAYPALHRAGFASQPHSHTREDGLTLTDLFITAAARCAPPGNKPTPQELYTCQPYLAQEIALLRPKVIVCLGQIAFERVLRILQQPGQGKKFGHGVVYPLQGGAWLIASYHPSQQNTLTGKLTTEMFDEIWQTARRLLEQ
jgi:uracil-DNA glycosylase family 4